MKDSICNRFRPRDFSARSILFSYKNSNCQVKYELYIEKKNLTNVSILSYYFLNMFHPNDWVDFQNIYYVLFYLNSSTMGALLSKPIFRCDHYFLTQLMNRSRLFGYIHLFHSNVRQLNHLKRTNIFIFFRKCPGLVFYL